MSVVGSISTRVGVVGAYGTAVGAAATKQVRDTAGRVTLTGTRSAEVVTGLARDRDVCGVDIDLAAYLQREKPHPTLFEVEDWEVDLQRRLGVAVVRSAGRYAPEKDLPALRAAFAEPVADGVVRVVSLHHSWLRARNRSHLLDAVARCEGPLAIVLASVFDPLNHADAVVGFEELVRFGTAEGRYVELLRTDIAAIPFAALGGRLGAVGLTTSTRHHGLPLPMKQKKAYDKRQSSPLIFVPRLLSWQRGNVLGALTSWDGDGLTDCGCAHCGGRSLLRFDGEWRTRPPADVQQDAMKHDVAAWTALAGRILASRDPYHDWLAACASAVHHATRVLAMRKVKVEPSPSVQHWAAMSR